MPLRDAQDSRLTMSICVISETSFGVLPLEKWQSGYGGRVFARINNALRGEFLSPCKLPYGIEILKYESSVKKRIHFPIVFNRSAHCKCYDDAVDGEKTPVGEYVLNVSFCLLGNGRIIRPILCGKKWENG